MLFVVGSATIQSGFPVLDLASGLNNSAFTGLVNGTEYYNIIGTIAISETPLPSTWTMLIAGFVGLGFFAYRGTKKNSAALAAA
jgi:hypothetical protein